MILANIDLYTILYTRNNLHYNPLKDIASFRCGSIANLCTPVRFRYPPPLKSIAWMITFPKNTPKTSYTIHTHSGHSSSLGKNLFRELQLISAYLHACFLSHEIHKNPDTLLRTNRVDCCDEIGKRSGEHFYTVSLVQTFGWEQCTRCIASEHKTRNQL